MPLLPATDLGQGPGIVLLHGVGVGPGSFRPLAMLLAVDHRVLVLERPAADGGAVPLGEQAAAVAGTIVDLDAAGAVVVGVSGGATLALALAIGHPEVVGGLVLHEPLVGAHAPALHATLQGAAQHAARGDAEALEVVRTLVGERSWPRLEPAARAQMEAGAARARAEIPLFAAFSPTTAELTGLRGLPLLTTVGSESAPERHAAALVLAELSGAAVAVVAGAANAVHLDAPDAFARTIRAWLPATIGCGG